MKKKIIIGTVVVVVMVALAVQPIMMSVTKRHSPYSKIAYTFEGMTTTVEYCQPYAKGREIFGALVPYGEVWRTGANDATVFEVDREITFAGEPLSAGRYALFTIPGEEEWTVILNSDHDQWGAFDHDPSLDVLRVTVKSEVVSSSSDQLVIQLGPRDDDYELTIAWDGTGILIPVVLAPGRTAESQTESS